MSEREKIERLLANEYSVCMKRSDADAFSEKYKVYRSLRLGGKVAEEVFAVDEQGRVIGRLDV